MIGLVDTSPRCTFVESSAIGTVTEGSPRGILQEGTVVSEPRFYGFGDAYYGFDGSYYGYWQAVRAYADDSQRL